MRGVRAIGCALALATALLVTNARADEYTKQTFLTFSGPVQLPGVTLAAGTYMFKLADPESGRRTLQVWDKEGTKLYATLLTIPDERMEATDQPVVMFAERPAGQAQAIKSWFYPEERFGQEFVYPKQQAMQIAKENHASVLSYNDDVKADDAATMHSAKVGRIDENGNPVADSRAADTTGGSSNTAQAASTTTAPATTAQSSTAQSNTAQSNTAQSNTAQSSSPAANAPSANRTESAPMTTASSNTASSAPQSNTAQSNTAQSNTAQSTTAANASSANQSGSSAAVGTTGTTASANRAGSNNASSNTAMSNTASNNNRNTNAAGNSAVGTSGTAGTTAGRNGASTRANQSDRGANAGNNGRTLPRTASPLMLIEMLSGLTLAAAFGVHQLRKRMAESRA